MNGSTVGSLNLRQLIQERRDEKNLSLRLKLFQKLRTIRNRRVYGVNTAPFPEGAFELLLSNEIWENVLAYLTDPSDLTTASFSSGTFAQILKGRRILLMKLPQVLNVFKLNTGNVDEEWRTGNEWKTICLKIREIKAWKDAAEFELFDSDFAMGDWYLHPKRIVKSKKACIFEVEKPVDEAISLLTHAHASSSLIRNVKVYVDYTEAGMEGFLRKVLEFLRIRGNAVWLFSFYTLSSRNFVHNYDYLCGMLKCMPNLKGLNIRFDIPEQPGHALQNFRERLNERPFPALDSLKHFNCLFETDECLLSQILGKCVNLKSVDYCFRQTVTDEMTEALAELTLERCVGSTGIITSNRMDWPLKNVTIKCQEGEDLLASVVFPSLNRLQGTLQHLEILLAPVKIDDTTFRLDLPHLKVLEIDSIFSGTMGFDDLILLKSLEIVGLKFIVYEKKNAKVRVKRYFYKDNMNKSNVWQCFPNLMCVKTFLWSFFRPTA